MANDKNIEPFQFKPGQSGNPNGRPRKFVTQMKDLGYKVSEINDTLQSLLACNSTELKDIYDHNHATVLEKAVCKALFEAMKSGDLRNLETILSRVFGYPKASFEATITEQPLLTDPNELMS